MVNLKERAKQHRTLVAITASVLVIAVLVGGFSLYAYAYSGKFYPGVSVGSVNVGGLSQEDGRAMVDRLADELVGEGIRVSIGGTTETIPLQLLSPDDPDLSQDIVVLLSDEAAHTAYRIGREGSLFVRAGQIISAAFGGQHVTVDTETNRDALESALLRSFGAFYDPATEPEFLISVEDDTWTVTVEPGSEGRSFDMDHAVEAIQTMLAELNLETVTIDIVDQEPRISDQDAEALEADVIAALEGAPYTLEYAPDRFDEHVFTLKGSDLATMLAPTINEETETVEPGLRGETWEMFVDDMIADINVEAQNARFSIQGDDRVQEFKPSQEGREINVEETYERLMATLMNPATEEDVESAAIEIAVETTQPEILTGEVNDLGITEVLGVGVSDFSGSPANRIANIRHGISKLEGTLIAPDEEFSLITALKPFTIADGYLPELVIKGDEIKPEVGGGLCQIGSTTFRAVMNSGLAITQRRNHSLVVNYYNDPSNGNPGTDATLYDPAPDFRFVNDTGNYILLTTEMDVSTGRLAFTFWGTSDGRKGYYSAPVVHNWIGAGPTQITYTTSLPPGVRRCQGAHPGANTSFTYTVEQADGEVDQTVYESHYRALPQICLVGVSEGQLDDEGNLIEEDVSPAEEDTESTPETETVAETE